MELLEATHTTLRSGLRAIFDSHFLRGRCLYNLLFFFRRIKDLERREWIAINHTRMKYRFEIHFFPRFSPRFHLLLKTIK